MPGQLAQQLELPEVVSVMEMQEEEAPAHGEGALALLDLEDAQRGAVRNLIE